jgi:hypothetical protein
MTIMKKNILFLLAFVAVIFASCNPLKDEINNIKPDPNNKTLVITATATYESSDAAKAGIVSLLNKSYPQFGDGTKANVTYSFKSNTIKPADSLFANIQYTVTTNDYTDASAVVGNGTFKTYSVAQATAFLDWKYPQATTPANKLVLLTYQFFQSNATPSAGVTVTEAFMLLDGWQKIYLVSPAQYASLGRGINNGFTSADVANLPSYFNNFLKADPSIIAPKVGDVKYITYKYLQSATIVHQKVYALSYDATGNWVPSLTLAFLKQDGQWIADPTIYYTMNSQDYLNLNLPNVTYTFGTATNRANVANFKSFNISATNGTQWTDAEIAQALSYTLNLKFPNATANPKIPYSITYYAYSGKYAYVPVKFIRTSTGFELLPQ